MGLEITALMVKRLRFLVIRVWRLGILGGLGLTV